MHFFQVAKKRIKVVGLRYYNYVWCMVLAALPLGVFDVSYY